MATASSIVGSKLEELSKATGEGLGMSTLKKLTAFVASDPAITAIVDDRIVNSGLDLNGPLPAIQVSVLEDDDEDECLTPVHAQLNAWAETKAQAKLLFGALCELVKTLPTHDDNYSTAEVTRVDIVGMGPVGYVSGVRYRASIDLTLTKVAVEV